MGDEKAIAGEIRVQGPGCRVQAAGFEVQSSGFRVQGCGGRRAHVAGEEVVGEREWLEEVQLCPSS